MSFIDDYVPTEFVVGNLILKVRTGTSFWIYVYDKMFEGTEEQRLNAITQGIESLRRAEREVTLASLSPEEAESVYARLFWFLRGGKASGGEEQYNGERLIDYKRDFDHIRCAILQSYNMNLLEKVVDDRPLIDGIHWWDFLRLVDNLPTGSVLVDYYMHYRRMDVSKLPNKTDADKQYRKHVMDVKAKVALDRPQQIMHEDPPYLVRARQMKGA